MAWIVNVAGRIISTDQRSFSAYSFPLQFPNPPKAISEGWDTLQRKGYDDAKEN